MNKYCKYPVGHPEIITEGFSDLSHYFGIIKCRVLAPSDLFLPVLPVRVRSKLLFPLCQKCSENLNQGVCEHTDNERAFVGTWVSEELKLAVKKGYKVLKVSAFYYY